MPWRSGVALEHGLGGARARDRAVACEAGVGREAWRGAGHDGRGGMRSLARRTMTRVCGDVGTTMEAR